MNTKEIEMFDTNKSQGQVENEQDRSIVTMHICSICGFKSTLILAVEMHVRNKHSFVYPHDLNVIIRHVVVDPTSD